MKKNFFEKIGLVENMEQPITQQPQSETITYQPTVEVSKKPVEYTENTIDDIYLDNNLSDKSKSIYKVQELISALPVEMLEKVKKDTVLSLLNVSNLSISELMNDAVNRKGILNAKMDDIVSTNEELINQSKQDIEELKEAINKALSIIDEKTKEINFITEVVEKENKKIDELIDFVGGDVNAIE